MTGNSWTHKAARPLIRPMIGTGITPNHLTTLRLLTGAAACVLYAWGTPAGVLWGGVIWLISAFLDRMDGELARIGRMMSRQGHLYDYTVDQGVNVAFFAAIGLGARHGWLGDAAVWLGLAAALSLLLCNWWSERLERLSPPDTRAYSGLWGFDPDDALYLMAPAGWLGLFPWILIGAALCTPVIAAITRVRLFQRQRHTGDTAPPEPSR